VCACWPSNVLQLFFAKVLRSANEDEVRGLFTRFGGVVEVNLFRAFQVSELGGSTQGCVHRAQLLVHATASGVRPPLHAMS
jgi:hypothetical protein